ncbi:thioesterase family protein [Oryzibacter oryziterrae]|uniref:thioesterase family protein n=1 Tax=Oryzibacter oryziterrae TaxID=2766474 RepID=UPI001F21984E|nr:thioesterase family protein [Oryzibacter oryziterrae]
MPKLHTIDPSWIDYNGHLNVGYYGVLFDRALDDAFEDIGLGAAHRAAGGHTFFVVESHMRYLAEVAADRQLAFSTRILALDAKRVHVFMEMRDAIDGTLNATSEQMLVSVSLATRKVEAMTPEESGLIEQAMRRTADEPLPFHAGRKIAMPAPR